MTAKLTPEQKLENAINRTVETYTQYTVGNRWNLFLKEVQRLAVISRANDDGMVRCVTSGKQFHVDDSDIHGGHFMKRNKRATAYLLDNVWPQSAYDNSFKDGEQEKLGKFLGEKKASFLRELSHEPDPFQVNGKFCTRKMVEYLVKEIRPRLKMHEDRISKGIPIEGYSDPPMVQAN